MKKTTLDEEVDTSFIVAIAQSLALPRLRAVHGLFSGYYWIAEGLTVGFS